MTVKPVTNNYATCDQFSEPAYDTLTGLVHRKSLEIIHIVAPPRTYGNALHLALTQSPCVAGQINEPHFSSHYQGRTWGEEGAREGTRSFDDGCSDILTTVESAQRKQIEKPVRVVIHNISADLNREEFEKMCLISKRTVFMTRPLQAIAQSLMMRYANDQFTGPASDKLNPQAVDTLMSSLESTKQYLSTNLDLQHLQNTSDKDLQILKETVQQLVIDKLERSWSNLFQGIRFCKDQKFPYTIFPSEQIFTEAVNHLETLSTECGIRYSDDMIHNWHKCVGKDFNCSITRNWGDLAHTNAWNGPARNSTGIRFQNNGTKQTVSLSLLPEKIQSSITQLQKDYPL